MNSSTLAKNRYELEGKKEGHYKLILDALNTLKEGCAKAIGLECNLDHYQVSRRMSELQNMSKVIVDRTEKTKHYKTPVSIYKLV